MALDDLRTSQDITKAAQAAIEKSIKGKKKIEDMKVLADALLMRTAPEDLERLSLDDHVALVKQVYDFSATREQGSHLLRISNQHFSGSDSSGVGATVIDICNDNMPFLYDSITDLLQERGFLIDLVTHPVIPVRRNAAGKRTSFASADDSAALRESVIQIHIERIEAAEARAELASELESVLNDVRLAVTDWQAMRRRLQDTVDAFKTNPPPIPVGEIGEAVQFLEWLLDNNFTFLGMREYGFSETAEMKGRKTNGLGVLSDPDVKVLRRGAELVTMTPEIRQFLLEPAPLIISKANVRSTIHRRVHMDYIGVKLYDETGKLDAELRVVGLFTSTAYTKSVLNIPYLRRKVHTVLDQSGFETTGHSGKALINILETYPRDELFQIDAETLEKFSLTIAQLDERPRVRVLARRDRFDRFVSILVYVPRDRYNTSVREAIGDHLMTVFDGRVSAFYPSFPEGMLARVHFIIGRSFGETPDIPQGELEAAVSHIIRTWEDDLQGAVYNAMEASNARSLLAQYSTAFRAAYRAIYSPSQAVDDMMAIEKLSTENRFGLDLSQDTDEPEKGLNLRLYHHGAPIPLSDRMPMIENLGFKAISEQTFRIKLDQGDEKRRVWIHDISIEAANGKVIDLETAKPLLEASFLAVWHGHAENDGFNALTLNAGLNWRDVALLRAYARYMRQIPTPYSLDYVWETLNTHNQIAFKLVDYFHSRFHPDMDHTVEMREAREGALFKGLDMALSGVDSLDEDRIIRGFLNLTQATLRTNYFQSDDTGADKPTIVFKLDPHKVEGLPLPRPYREIFVYSPRVEGVHLRFGPVARGGLRWSDRPQDFRTEVLGLVKAQQVKNAVIVPVGSKGGFVPKHLPLGGDRNAIFEEGREAYKIFIQSLLDVTDNLDVDKVVPPTEVVRLDGDDPYLVVAADKGTATFSDTANAISEGHGFWLGDAFASGGSAGYDHKKMGITARGGWEAVKRHFREMDIDIQSEPFTVVGCGDMSGDVFGNGMLLSKCIKLVAAFDHRDIFIDPDPDPATSYEERQRLFEMGRSSWADYNTDLISKGGGVFSRAQKSIQVSAQIKTALDLPKTRLSPFELINAILKADADLLWFGGIGTYIRAPEESDADVGDRANDPVRVTTNDLRVKVIGEGANLGVTQKARIAFSANGGRVNSDAIDNSAGVNSSDVEVNIKIALGAAVRAGKLKTPARNRLLASMTDEVASLVLQNNYQQTLSVSIAQDRGLSETEFQGRFMADLEARGMLDRAVEDLPDPIKLAERIADGEPLTRPELAVILAYAKITLFDELLATDVPDDHYFEASLMGYFPTKMRKKYAGEIASHRLRREIITTNLANSIINRGGPVFVNRIADQMGASVGDIARAYVATRDSFDMLAINGGIDDLDTKISGQLQIDLYRSVQDLLWSRTPWFLRNMDGASGIQSTIDIYGAGIASLSKGMSKILPDDSLSARDAEVTAMVDKGVPEALAIRLSDMSYLESAPDIIRVAEVTGAKLLPTAQVYFAVSDLFATDRLMASIATLNAEDYYDRVALNRAVDSVASARRRMTETVIREKGSGKGALDRWMTDIGSRADKTREMLGGLSSDQNLTVSKVSVAAAMLGDLVPE